MIDLLTAIREEASGLLAGEPYVTIRAAFDEAGIDPVLATEKLAEGALDGSGVTSILSTSDRHLSSAVSDGGLEQFLLIAAIRAYAPQIVELPIPEEARRELATYHSRLLRPEPRIAEKMRLGHSWYLSACKLVTGRRYPAGCYEYEISGIPRSWFLRIARSSPRDLARFAFFVSSRTRGLKPFFANHMAILRDPSDHLTMERVAEAYLTIADTLRLQPRVKGLLAAGWMRDPKIGVVSPHLAALSDPILSYGGIQIGLGEVDPERSGALAKSRRRRDAFEQGLWRPAQGVALWPRDGMLRWADAYRNRTE